LNRFCWGGEHITVTTLNVPQSLEGKRIRLRATVQGFELEYPVGTLIGTGKVGDESVVKTSEGDISIFIRDLVARPGSTFTLTRSARETLQKRLLASFAVKERGRSSGVIYLTYSATSPRFAAGVINSLEDAYLRQNVERRSAEAALSLEFLKKQLPKRKEQVAIAQANLNGYQLRNGSVNVSRETDLVLTQSVALETNRLQLEQKREEALQQFTPQHPTIRAIDDQIRAIEREEVKQNGVAAKLPTTQQEILSLTRDLDVANQLYTEMLNSTQQLEVAKAGTVGNVRIVDYATPPLHPSEPRPSLIITVGVLAGFILGFIGVLIQVALMRGIDDPSEVEAQLGLSAYAAIPYSPQQRKMELGNNRDGGLQILAVTDSADFAIEALRSLRNSLHFLMLESPNNILMLSGPAPGLGKSFVSINLAAVLAISGKKVALVDGDLRKGHLHKYIGAPASPGVSEFVAQNMPIEKVLLKTSVEGLSLVTRGGTPPNPSELLLHERFTEMVRLLSETHDLVLIDTPPVLPVADAAIVGRIAGCTLLVLKSAQHPMREIEETYRRLAQAGANVRGTIFNQVGRRVGSYGYGGYGYSYAYNNKYRYK
jgi:tyrosine-protein kinase Etk/Wzc